MSEKLIAIIKETEFKKGYLHCLIKALDADTSELDKLKEDAWEMGHKQALIDVGDKLSTLFEIDATILVEKITGPSDPSPK